MRILLDECVPARVKRAFPGHSVRTVADMGWRSTKDAILLQFAEGKFDLLLTVDRQLALEFQRQDRRLALMHVETRGNQLSHFLPLFALMREAAESIQPGTVMRVDAIGIRTQ